MRFFRAALLQGSTADRKSSIEVTNMFVRDAISVTHPRTRSCANAVSPEFERIFVASYLADGALTASQLHFQ